MFNDKNTMMSSVMEYSEFLAFVARALSRRGFVLNEEISEVKVDANSSKTLKLYLKDNKRVKNFSNLFKMAEISNEGTSEFITISKNQEEFLSKILGIKIKYFVHDCDTQKVFVMCY